ncbi:hypothetical protein [Bacillus pumilus]|uniref:hypothetical protein n=1 Tax=Bacillus pumilus TaxID=1408 RepID=UPI00119F6125|nr:hypothetical protein [Bacillus pumilus]
MALNAKDRKLLWGNAALRCSLCRITLLNDDSEWDDTSVYGEECHIAGKKKDSDKSPRSDADLDNREVYDNYILLCRNDHKMVDDQREKYTIEVLREIKEKHEKWVETTLDSSGKQAIYNRYYKKIVNEWAERIDLKKWKDWTYDITVYPYPQMPLKRFEEFSELNQWMLTRILPGLVEEIDIAFMNFNNILNDFLLTFESRSILMLDGKLMRTEKFYQHKGDSVFDFDRYDRLKKEYDEHINLVTDLVFELTRGGNYLCETVRDHLGFEFQLEAGMLTLITSVGIFEKASTCKPQYSSEDRQGTLYNNLENFKVKRYERDFYTTNPSEES